MPESLLKHFTIRVEQKLCEKTTPMGQLTLYQTADFGKMLLMNDRIVVSEQDGFFYNEMMAHPALFTHPNPEKIAIIGNSFGILEEVLKHPRIKEITCVHRNPHLHDMISEYFTVIGHDVRVNYESEAWLLEQTNEKLDIIIETEATDNFKHYHQLLRADGILLQATSLSLFQLTSLKPLTQLALDAGFNHWQTLNFPQPSYPSGWRTAMMATKSAMFKRVREKDVFNRTFNTRYYNFDVHQAALVLPEFVRNELGK